MGEQKNAVEAMVPKSSICSRHHNSRPGRDPRMDSRGSGTGTGSGAGIGDREVRFRFPAEKKKPAPVKQEKPKKPVPPPKKAELKNPVEERRNNHLNVMRITYEVTDSQDVKITPASNATVISKYSSNKNRSGKYYHTKQGVLLCDSGPCEINWSAKFAYTDENGKEDALLLKWKETVFNGITPAGTSKQELECCLNGQCWKMQEDSKTETQEFSIGERYRLAWNKSSLIIRRSDIMKEVLDAGRSLSDY